MFLKLSRLWINDPGSDTVTHQGYVRGSALLIESSSIFYLLIPYQEFDKEAEFGTIIDIMGYRSVNDVIGYANKRLGQLGHEDIIAEWTDMPRFNDRALDLSLVLSWSSKIKPDQDESADLGDRPISVLSQFGTIELRF